MLAHARGTVSLAHLPQYGRRLRVSRQVVEGSHSGVAFHVRLPGENEDFERTGRRSCGSEADKAAQQPAAKWTIHGGSPRGMRAHDGVLTKKC